MQKSLDLAARLIGTVFGCGYSAFAPGTVGSAAGLLLFWPMATAGWPWQAAASIVLFVVGSLAAGRVARLENRKDPSIVVVDEVVGQWVTLTALPFTHLGGTAENLLGSFDDPASIVQGGGWSHDPAVGRTTPGSLQVTANGSERSFKSEVINVKEDQEFQASIYATWAGLTFSGSDPFQLRVLKYLNGTAVGTPVVLAAPTSPGANQPAWTLLDTPAGMSGFFAVPAGHSFLPNCRKVEQFHDIRP
jgi:phosphatidylglycerophosphatase A